MFNPRMRSEILSILFKKTLYGTFQELFMVFMHLRKGHSNAELMLLVFFSIFDRFLK